MQKNILTASSSLDAYQPGAGCQKRPVRETISSVPREATPTVGTRRYSRGIAVIVPETTACDGCTVLRLVAVVISIIGAERTSVTER